MIIREVGPRDGLQDVKKLIPTDDKVRLVDALSATGLSDINAASCVSPKAVPQMADGDEVLARIARRPGVRFSVTAPNETGLSRALAGRADAVGLPLSASETFQRRNVNASVEETLARLAPMVARVRVEAPACEVGVAISMAFGSPFEGTVDPGRVADLAARAADLGAAQVVLADTTGTGDPRQVRRVLALTRAAVGDRALIGVHFHDPRGLGLANALAALEAGCEAIDASVGGLGGCPFAGGASAAGGNIATEDLVQMLEAMGMATGIDLDALIRCAELAEAITGVRVVGRVMRAGKIPFRNPS